MHTIRVQDDFALTGFEAKALHSQGVERQHNRAAGKRMTLLSPLTGLCIHAMHAALKVYTMSRQCA